MTQATLKPIVLSILLISSPILAHAHETEQTVDLETVNVVGTVRLPPTKSSPAILCGKKPSISATRSTACRASMLRNTAVARLRL